MDLPPTQYVERDGAALAFQVTGHGPVDFVQYSEISQHTDLMWTDPDIHALWEQYAPIARIATFQRRGFGLSEPVRYTPTLEQQADDVIAVMDAAGMERAAAMGVMGNCGAVALAAAQAPERFVGLVLVSPIAQGALVGDEPAGWTEPERTRFVESLRCAGDNWGSGDIIDMWDEHQATPRNRRLMGLLERCSSTPAAATAHIELSFHLDISDVLRSVPVPARALHLPGGKLPAAVVSHVAELLPLGELHELEPTRRGDSLGGAWSTIFAHAEEVATGSRHNVDVDRFLGSVVFTDVVGSTELLARIGDTAYRDLRAEHERRVRLIVEDAGGRLVTVTGDGTLSVFENGPSAAVRCAERICTEAGELHIAVRAGVHTGELIRDGLNVAGMAVHAGARVGGLAGPGEVLVSRTVRDLVAGSGLTFDPRGERELKGVPGRWELFQLTHASEQAANLPVEEPMTTPMDRMALGSARRAPGLTRAAMRLGNAVQRRRYAER